IAGYGRCRYRLTEHAEDTVRCAVGVLIPDNVYEPEFEEHALCSLQREFPELLGEEGSETGVFLHDIQTLHDRCATVRDSMSYFLEELDQRAVTYGAVPNRGEVIV